MPKTHEPTVNKACQPCKAAKVACKRGSVDRICQRCEQQRIECAQVKRKDRVVTATLAHVKQLEHENTELNQKVVSMTAQIDDLVDQRNMALGLLVQHGLDQQHWPSPLQNLAGKLFVPSATPSLDMESGAPHNIPTPQLNSRQLEVDTQQVFPFASSGLITPHPDVPFTTFPVDPTLASDLSRCSTFGWTTDFGASAFLGTDISSSTSASRIYYDNIFSE
ncbi:hypothetical protein EXIGLDRAFT_718910 [Exidia glandulosa HHB12029]|uniref:Zn(2)-C6 fungal-type domain-containing protein n=1 Tax=Exidia glandulosa HHB12029 TaxID=1314781 RepID=A0A166AH16_EXIGL|nr:hypothetical protein EXIGLDRAFT_718910 [Exidia glandulosa HHB12029]